MKYREAVEILREFDNQNRDLWLRSDLIGTELRIEEDSTNLVIAVSIDSTTVEDSVSNEAYGLSDSFTHAGASYAVKLEKSIAPKPHIDAGTDAFGAGLAGVGTYGWGFYLNGVPTALSNWHVLCPNGNNTPLGNRCFIDGQDVASLSSFERLGQRGNLWDLALATFDDEADLEAFMRQCVDGTRRPYPYKMEWNPELGTKYHKVGRTAPICREGSFQGIGSTRVEYDDGTVRRFVDQLLFKKMSDKGDSGAIIVNSNSNEIAGLNFAGNDKTTIANPLFLTGWKYRGTLALENGLEIPEYETFTKTAEGELESVVSAQPGKSMSSEVPPSIGGARRELKLVTLGSLVSKLSNSGKSIKIIGKHGDWLYLSWPGYGDIFNGGVFGLAGKGWYHPSSNYIFVD